MFELLDNILGHINGYFGSSVAIKHSEKGMAIPDVQTRHVSVFVGGAPALDGRVAEAELPTLLVMSGRIDHGVLAHLKFYY